MNDGLQTAYSGYAGSDSVVARNRVLRNTYWLLALSMVPTVLGAWVGVTYNFNLFAANPLMGFIAFMAIAFGFFYAIEKTKNSGLGVVLLLAFTFFMGLMLSRLIHSILGFSNGSELIMMAFGGTAVVFFGMATLATTIKRDISGMGKWLMVGVLGLIAASVANIWLQMPALFMAVSVLAIVIFSAFILHDLKRVIDGGETNYVTATLSVYLSLYNIFQSILSLLGIFGGQRD
ncbi:Bax inhibitor-1/YccA family protein [soil metagenome]